MVALALVALGLVLGYGTGRYLWLSKRLVLALWPIIAVLAVVGLITSRIFALLDMPTVWQLVFFPLLVGWGAGLAVTPARPPRHGAWWQVWKT
jgi:hypothetical protein